MLLKGEETNRLLQRKFPDAAFLSLAASSDTLVCSATGWMKQFKLYPQQFFNRNEFIVAQVQDLLRVLPEDKSERNLRSLWRTESSAVILLHSLERNPAPRKHL